MCWSVKLEQSFVMHLSHNVESVLEYKPSTSISLIIISLPSHHNFWNLISSMNYPCLPLPSALDCRNCGVMGFLLFLKCCRYCGTVFTWLWGLLCWSYKSRRLGQLWPSWGAESCWASLVSVSQLWNTDSETQSSTLHSAFTDHPEWIKY